MLILSTHVFQKPSNAVIKPDFGVSSHGSSSMKISCLLPSSIFCKNISNIKKASIQLSGHLLFSFHVKEVSCKSVSAAFLMDYQYLFRFYVQSLIPLSSSHNQPFKCNIPFPRLIIKHYCMDSDNSIALLIFWYFGAQCLSLLSRCLRIISCRLVLMWIHKNIIYYNSIYASLS